MTGARERTLNTASTRWALLCSLGAVLLGWTEAHGAGRAEPVSAYLDAVALFGLPLAVAALLLGPSSDPKALLRTAARARYGGSRRREALRKAVGASLLLASTVGPLFALGLLGTPAEVSTRDLWITLEVTWLGAQALYGVGLLVRAWAGRVGVVLLLLAEWASALPTGTPVPLLPPSHIGHLLAVGTELGASAAGSFALLALSAILGVTLASARIRP